MSRIQRILLSGIIVLLAACAGVGVIESSDPYVKLDQAEYLFSRAGRPIPAEKLIFEAMAIFRDRNDYRGLGHAYREYAGLLQTLGIVPHSLVQNEFMDPSITQENRLAKAYEYYVRALDSYTLALPQVIEPKDFGKRTDIYLNMATNRRHFTRFG